MSDPYFTKDLFAFFRELADNNNKEWFEANRERYERSVREPALEFITDFAGRLEEISPHFAAEPRKSGGSLFRIHRDVRFSKDKTPYKTNTGIQFRHEMGRDAHAPGFYLHLAPRDCFIGVGLWRPPTPVAARIRAAIDAEPDRWRSATHSDSFTQWFSLGGESLKRPPKGFDADHPLIDDLKRKDFIASGPVTQTQITSGELPELFTQRCQAAAPFMAFLCDAVGVKF